MGSGQENTDFLLDLRRYLHDLKQPLNVMSLACGNIRDRIGRALSAEDAEYLDRKLARIEGQVQRAADMIEGKLHELPRRPQPDNTSDNG